MFAIAGKTVQPQRLWSARVSVEGACDEVAVDVFGDEREAAPGGGGLRIESEQVERIPGRGVAVDGRVGVGEALEVAAPASVPGGGGQVKGEGD